MKKILLILLFTSSLFAQSELLVLFSGYGIKNFDVANYNNALTTKLSDAQAQRIDNLVTMLKDSLSIDTLAEKFDVMYILANETSEAGLKNLVKRSHDAQLLGTTAPPFTQWQGFQGNGAGYIKCNYLTNGTGNVVYTQDDASIGIYVRTNIGESFGVCGRDDASPASIHLQPRRATNSSNMKINDNTDVYPATVTNSQGFTIGSRTASNVLNLYLNSVPGTQATTASTGFPNDATGILILTPNVVNFSSHQVSFFFMGSSLDATEVRKVTNCIERYMDAIGTGVIP